MLLRQRTFCVLISDNEFDLDYFAAYAAMQHNSVIFCNDIVSNFGHNAGHLQVIKNRSLAKAVRHG
jgi:hypothetical protein